MTIGTDSALHRIIEAVDAIATTALRWEYGVFPVEAQIGVGGLTNMICATHVIFFFCIDCKERSSEIPVLKSFK